MFILVSGIVLSLPFVQTKIGKYVTTELNKEFKTNINVNQVTITIFGGVKLRDVLIKDHHKDTLIYINLINTNILDAKKLYKGDLLFGTLRLNKLYLNLKNYKNEKETNLDKFIAAFDTKKPSTEKFLLTAKDVYFTESRFLLTDENRTNPKDLELIHLEAKLSNFKILGPDVTTVINKMSFKDYRGLVVNNLQANFIYTKKNIVLKDLVTNTKESLLKGDVTLKYDRKDFKDFNNKVLFDIKINEAKVATNDIRYFYKELGKNNVFDLKGNIRGYLNNFRIKNLHLIDSNNSVIIGNVNFRNLFSKNKNQFNLIGTFSKVSSNYSDLSSLLPNILGKSLPSSLIKLGQFNLSGSTNITTTAIESDFDIETDLGKISADVVLTNIDFIDNASYVGNIILDNFNIGSFLNNSNLGIASLNVDVEGKGFTENLIDTKLVGEISQLEFNNYNYTKIILNGTFKKPIFKGKVNVNDPNLFLDFDGLVDVSKKENVYKFKTQIDYANLKELNFITKDSLSIFKGKIDSNLTGNSINNLYGDVVVEHTSYQNERDIFIFEDFKLNSTFDQNLERTITINSPDIIEGKVVGKFDFEQVLDIIENSFGSIYTNYKPNKIRKGQYLKFNLSVFSKIIEIFYPEIVLSKNTFLKGSMNSDTNDFKMNFSSPKISVLENQFEKVNLEIDNKNNLYNTYIQIDSIKTKYYKVADFNLINITMKDSLLFRAEFKGGKNNQDYYNINAYHTIDINKNSVVGIQKSELNLNNYIWHINVEENNKNRIIFNKNFNNFVFDEFEITNQDQKIKFLGKIENDNYKDLKLDFSNVNLGKIIPEYDKLIFDGTLNGIVNFEQINSQYKPYASLVVDDLEVNNIKLGNLNLDVKGNRDFNNFEVSSTLKNKNLENLNIEGSLAITNKKPIINLDLRLNNFNIGAFSIIGGSAISNIRGMLSGAASFEGDFKNPEMNGRLFLKEAGLKVPYLNVDYQLENNAIVDLTDRQFLFRNINLTDTKYNTKGILSGTIRHTNLKNWNLDLAVNSNHLLVLDTKDQEDAYYYGTAFIGGIATISGLTNALFINVEASSKKGTIIKIPIAETLSVGDNNYLRFITPQEKFNLSSNLQSQKRNYQGLELNFDLDVNTDAEIEVILDRETGHLMNGSGVGNLYMQINTLGKFNMYGDFQIYKGKYFFKYRGIVSKVFDVKEYGSIVWDGDPLKARLNLQAVYKTVANPAVLLDNPSFNRKIPVEVGIDIGGNIANPEPNFSINFPTVSSVLKSEIQTKLSDSDTRQTQALYLLASSSFLTPEGGLNQNALSQNLFDTASGIFGDLLNDKDSKILITPEVVTADNTPGREASGSVGFNTKFNINDKITVNGKFGVPVGGLNNAAVIGDVEILYKVNKDGTFNMRFFNRQNDINYIGENFGYTQGLGVSYQVDFNTFKELINKVFKNAKLTKDSSPDDQIPDSDYNPEFIEFIQRKKIKSESTKTNQEVIPDEL